MSESNPPTTPWRRRLPIVVGILLALVFLAPLCAFQVRTTQVAIKRTLGRSGRTPIGPGLHWKWPWPIQKVTKYNTVLHVLKRKSEESYTADGNNLVISLFALWRIADPVLFMERVGSVDEAQRVLDALISDSRGAVVARHPLSHLVSTDEQQLQFAAIENEIQKGVDTQAKSSGISVEMIGIEQLALPEEITKNVFARMRAERAYSAEQIRLQGEEEAAQITAAARLKSEQAIAAAEAEAKRTRGQGKAAAARAYLAFKADPEFALFLRKLESLQELTKSKTTIIIDRDIIPFDLLDGLHIPEVKDQAGGAKREPR